MDDKNEMIRLIDKLIANVIEERTSWEKRRQVAQERIAECDEQYRTLDVLRMEILFKE